ncbi:MAG: glycine--tRNA ligase subunit alpha [bacterium]|nr:glycine--tRNA ligase subunit alpha [bacterium]
MNFQDIIIKLDKFWKNKGCLLGQPYPGEVGAGTFNPLTFFRVLGAEPWSVAYVELSKRPKDGRYAENPNRLQEFHQYQVILKPAPNDVQEVYLKSLSALGIEVKRHDVRFVEDDWESEALDASGVGWEVWLDGMEITQFTYFQKMGGIELNPISVELTYGLGRLAMIIQKKDSMFDVDWARGVKFGDLYKRQEYELSRFNFDEASVDLEFDIFNKFEQEAIRFIELKLLYPAYDYIVKCSHILNVLDARKAISPEERKSYIARVRKLSNLAARLWLEKIT